MEEDELQLWKDAGKAASKARDLGASMVEEGVTYLEVVEAVDDQIHDMGAKVAFPTNLAINDVAAHYTPRPGEKLKFKHGDLVKVDVGAHFDGRIGDTAKTVEVGTNTYADLIQAAKQSLMSALEVLRGGIALSTIGSIVERTINSKGFKPIVNLTGHSIERYNLHAGLSVPNYDDRSREFIPSGTIVAIEPFATTGLGEVRSWKRSNIYKYVRPRSKLKEDQENALKIIQKGRPHLPFSDRWLDRRMDRSEKALRGLVRAGSVYSYPILKEVSGGMVSQWEHTTYVTEKGCNILTY
ncbi:MAG: type II methionyl aminopeptidase [Candidatus Thermoplasmatota archaeon]|nr:type II methionyl aminopeptidase [Candidatus Thermoplasmatota archaeon]